MLGGLSGLAGLAALCGGAAPPFDPDTAAAVVAGAGSATSDGRYERSGDLAGKGFYALGDNNVYWTGSAWNILDNVSLEAIAYTSPEDVAYPWLVTTWTAVSGAEPVPTVQAG